MLISGPFFGRFGDRFGAKSAMMACYIGSFVFYFFLAIADDVTDLFLSRLAAFLMHAFHCKYTMAMNRWLLIVILYCVSFSNGYDRRLRNYRLAILLLLLLLL